MRENATILELGFNIFLWLLILIISKRTFIKPYLLKKEEKRLLYFCLFLFCMFPFMTGDYFHYLDDFNQIKKGEYSHMEVFYIHLIDNYCYSYHVFRLVVWGSALLLTVYGYRRLNLKNDLVIALLGILFIPWFSYARATLSMACIFLGITFFANPIKNRKLIGYIIGILLIGVSIFFHRSAIVGIIAAVLSIIFSRPSKKILVCLSILFPALIYLASYLLSQFVLMDYEEIASEGMKNTYLGDGADTKKGIGELIFNTLIRLPLFMIGFAYIISIFKGYTKDMGKSIQTISQYMFYIVIIAFFFTFDLGYNTYTLYYRTLNYAIIPSVVFLSHIRIHNQLPIMFKLIMNITIIGLIYTFLYSIYLSLVVGG